MTSAADDLALNDFDREVIRGLTQSPKMLPAKFFYDARGSVLFDEICTLEEYYPTRTELGIMTEHGPDMARVLGAHCKVVEFGSGSGLKTRLLLQQLDRPAAYCPIEISQAALEQSVEALEREFPDLTILPVHADYTARVDIPDVEAARTIVYFPGSTLGNFVREDARAFLRNMRAIIGPQGVALVGIDLVKNPNTLHAAYNDSLGVTAEFNKNMMHRLRANYGEGISPDDFDHYALYHPLNARIEMYLVANKALTWEVKGHTVQFAQGEAILTEYSHKYTPASFEVLAVEAGLKITHQWTDAQERFAVFGLTHGAA